jgi:hypothetical protein
MGILIGADIEGKKNSQEQSAQPQNKRSRNFAGFFSKTGETFNGHKLLTSCNTIGKEYSLG